MSKMYRQVMGRRGEQRAADYLHNLGYTILAHNVRTPHGEIDLVALQTKPTQPNDEAVIVFVEVKARTTSTYGLPEESITAQKKAHLLAAIQAYMQDHPELPGTWRVDVIAIRYWDKAENPEIVHFENALS